MVTQYDYAIEEGAVDITDFPSVQNPGSDYRVVAYLKSKDQGTNQRALERARQTGVFPQEYFSGTFRVRGTEQTRQQELAILASQNLKPETIQGLINSGQINRAEAGLLRDIRAGRTELLYTAPGGAGNNPNVIIPEPGSNLQERITKNLERRQLVEAYFSGQEPQMQTQQLTEGGFYPTETEQFANASFLPGLRNTGIAVNYLFSPARPRELVPASFETAQPRGQRELSFGELFMGFGEEKSSLQGNELPVVPFLTKKGSVGQRFLEEVEKGAQTAKRESNPNFKLQGPLTPAFGAGVGAVYGFNEVLFGTAQKGGGALAERIFGKEAVISPNYSSLFGVSVASNPFFYGTGAGKFLGVGDYTSDRDFIVSRRKSGEFIGGIAPFLLIPEAKVGNTIKEIKLTAFQEMKLAGFQGSKAIKGFLNRDKIQVIELTEFNKISKQIDSSKVAFDSKSNLLFNAKIKSEPLPIEFKPSPTVLKRKLDVLSYNPLEKRLISEELALKKQDSIPKTFNSNKFEYRTFENKNPPSSMQRTLTIQKSIFAQSGQEKRTLMDVFARRQRVNLMEDEFYTISPIKLEQSIYNSRNIFRLSTIRPNSTQKIGLVSFSGELNKIKQKNNLLQTSVSTSESGIKSKQILNTLFGQKNPQNIIQKNNTAIIELTDLKNVQDFGLKLVPMKPFKTLSKIRSETASNSFIKLSEKPLSFTLLRPRLKKAKLRSAFAEADVVEGFNAFVKEQPSGRGSFRKVTSKPLPYSNARQFGFEVADNTIAQSVKLVKANRKIKPQSSPFNDSGFKFRQKGNTFIEKRANAIDTFGEKQKLKVSKYLAQRKRAAFNLF